MSIAMRRVVPREPGIQRVHAECVASAQCFAVAAGDSLRSVCAADPGQEKGSTAMRKAIEGCVVSVLLIGCSNGIGDDVPRHGETETHGSSSGSDSGSETAASETTASETGGGGGCVLTQGYWKNHNASAKHHNQIAWPIAEDTALCDSTWLEILWTPPKGGNAWIILAHQWIAARLNVAAGASAPDEIGAAIDEAGGMLDACSIADGDRDHALELAGVLDDYNNGMMGIHHCGGDDDDDEGDDDHDEGDDDDDDDHDDDGHDDACDDDDDGGGGGGTTGDGDEGCDACSTTGDDDDDASTSSSTGTSSSGGTSMSSSGG
jgi:hypothetical protein